MARRKKKVMEQRLKSLGDDAVDCVERAMGEISLDWQKDQLVDTGIVNTGKLRHIIQSIKELKDIEAKDLEKENKAEASQLLKALEMEDDAE